MKKTDKRLPFSEIGKAELAALYEWDVADAIKAQEEWKIKYPQGTRGPLYRWESAQWLEKWRRLHETEVDKNKYILPALFECAMDGLPIPAWCAQAFINAFRDVRHYREKSWDDVFGKPHPKGMQIAAKRRKKMLEFAVLGRVREIKAENPDTPIDESLFEEIGKELGICKTLVGEYYYSAKGKLKLSPTAQALLQPYVSKRENESGE
jgi:hypothetical protein